MVRLTYCSLLLGSTGFALGAIRSASLLRPRSSKPANPRADNTTSDCTWWHDYNAVVQCDTLLEENTITLEDFRKWNPSITANCDGLTLGRSYCVEAAFESEKSKAPAAKTGPSNDIETPVPTQLKIASNCDKFYFVKSGETCTTVADANGITVDQLLEWNPSAGSTCASLWANAYACVSIVGHEPTPIAPSNGIQTPLPTQPGMVRNCTKFDMVRPGEYCILFASRNNIALEDFMKWNPKVGKACEVLLANAYACVSVI